jgi:hypothetical protein
VALYTDVGWSGYSYQAELNTEPGVTNLVYPVPAGAGGGTGAMPHSLDQSV